MVSVVPIIVDHRLVSANDKRLIMILNYRLLIKFCLFFSSTEYCMFRIKMLLHIMAMIDRSISLMVGVMADVIPSSRRPCAEIFKIASRLFRPKR